LFYNDVLYKIRNIKAKRNEIVEFVKILLFVFAYGLHSKKQIVHFAYLLDLSWLMHIRYYKINMHEILLRFKILILIDCLLSDIKFVLNLFKDIASTFVFYPRNIYINIFEIISEINLLIIIYVLIIILKINISNFSIKNRIG